MPTCEIPLTKGMVAIVDEADYAKVAGHRWQALRRGLLCHAVRREGRRGARKTVYMHRQILDAPATHEVDHEDGNGLNNRRHNIRLCTHAQNAANVRRQLKYKTSRYHGVSWSPARSRWRPTIVVSGKQHYLGLYRDEQEAAKAYDRAAIRHFGEFASPNFPRSNYVVSNL